MKTQQKEKLFKRKTMSLKFLHSQQKINRTVNITTSSTKYLSPKNIIGLNSEMYKKEQSMIKVLQQQVNSLKSQINQLEEQNNNLNEQNKQLKTELQLNSETYKKIKNDQFSTVKVLNQLKQTIQQFNEDQQLSTFDDINIENIEDVCNCAKYQKQVKQSKQKVRFLQQSLIHSQQIIIKLQRQIKKIKTLYQENLNRQTNTVNYHYYNNSQHDFKTGVIINMKKRNQNNGLNTYLSKQREKRNKYNISSIQQIIEDSQQ